MEIEIREGEIQQHCLAGKAALARRQGKDDFLVFLTVHLLRLDGLDEFHCLGDARLQIVKCLFVIGKSRRLDAGDTGAGVDRMIAGRTKGNMSG